MWLGQEAAPIPLRNRRGKNNNPLVLKKAKEKTKEKDKTMRKLRIYIETLGTFNFAFRNVKPSRATTKSMGWTLTLKPKIVRGKLKSCPKGKRERYINSKISVIFFAVLSIVCSR